MPIIQPDPREDQLPSAVISSFEAPVELLEPPQKTRRDRGNMAIILWPLLLALGSLILLARSPSNAPAFEQLTQYVCDAEPILQGRSLRASRGVILTCRSGDQIVLQRGLPSYSNNPAFTECRRSGGLIRIWRMPKPSPYGSYVFHATCDDHVIAYYPDRARAYDSIQLTITAIAAAIILGGALGLAARLTKPLRARKTNL